MKNDITLRIIGNDLVEKIFDSIPMRYDDLQGVIFLTNEQLANLAMKRGNSATSVNGPSSASKKKNRPTSASSGGGSSGTVMQEYQQYIDNLTTQFYRQYDFQELLMATTVVLEEESLQKAIQTEQKALVTKGVFIPLLRPISESSLTQPRDTSGGLAHGGGEDQQGDSYAPQIASLNPFGGNSNSNNNNQDEEESSMRYASENYGNQGNGGSNASNSPSKAVVTNNAEFSSLPRNFSRSNTAGSQGRNLHVVSEEGSAEYGEDFPNN